MNKINLVDMKPGMVYDEPVYLDGRYILLTPDIPTTQELISELTKWNYNTLFTPGSPQGKEIARGIAMSNGASLEMDQKEQEGLTKARTFYMDFLDFTEKLIENFKRTNSLDLEKTADFLKKTIDLLKENQYFILRFSEISRDDEDREYFITHAVRSTILALTMALNAKSQRIPPHKIIELGISCLLHEIGMLQIPPQIYNKKGDLSPEEKKTITAHPILGYRLLKEMKGIAPLSHDILMGVLEHHERENGSGYPQKLTGDKISIYGKIISIACSYDAQISNRPYREGKDGHSSMTSLLKEMQSHYDPGFVSALMSSISLFPLGSYVEMGDGSIATVVKVSEENIRLPFVKILLDPQKHPVMDASALQTETIGHLSIVRVLNDREIETLREESLIQ